MSNDFRIWPDLEHDAVDVFAGQTVLHEMKVNLDRSASYQVVGTVSAGGKPVPNVVLRALPDSLDDQLRQTMRRGAALAQRLRDRQTSPAVKRELKLERRVIEQELYRLSRQVRERDRTPGGAPPSPGAGALSETDAKGRYELWLPDPGPYKVLAESHTRFGKQVLAAAAVVIKKPAPAKKAATATTGKPAAKPKPRKPVRLDINVDTGSLILTLTKHTGYRIGGGVCSASFSSTRTTAALASSCGPAPITKERSTCSRYQPVAIGSSWRATRTATR